MSQDDVRRGVANAKLNEDNSNILLLEFLIIAGAFGFYLKSWPWFGGILIGLFIMTNIKVLAKLLIIALSLAWGGIGYGLGHLFGSEGAMYTLAIIGFLIGLGVHLSAIQWVQDIGADSAKSG